MAYLKQRWFTAKVFNKFAMTTGLFGTKTLTITRRSSGQPQQIPVLTVDVDGAKYLVSTRGESQWVKNVRARPQVTLSVSGRTVEYTAAEIPVEQRAPVLAAFRKRAGKTVDGYFRKLPDPADHPVFTLTAAPQ